MENLGPWIFASVALIVVGFLIYRYPRPTLIAVGVVALVGVAGIGTLLYFSAENGRRYQEEQARAETLIPPAHIDLQEMRLGFDGALWSLSGTVMNTNTANTLVSLTLGIRVFACERGQDCPAIGDTEQTIHLRVPPLQARQVDDLVFFSPTPQVTKESPWHWNWEIEKVVGEVSK